MRTRYLGTKLEEASLEEETTFLHSSPVFLRFTHFFFLFSFESGKVSSQSTPNFILRPDSFAVENGLSEPKGGGSFVRERGVFSLFLLEFLMKKKSCLHSSSTFKVVVYTIQVGLDGLARLVRNENSRCRRYSRCGIFRISEELRNTRERELRYYRGRPGLSVFFHRRIFYCELSTFV